MPTINPTLPNDGETADAADVSTPLAIIIALLNGNLDADNIAPEAIVGSLIANNTIPGAKLQENTLELTNLIASWDGWVEITDSWAYASATTITVPTDATTKYDVGDFIRIVQSSTTKYFQITAITSTILTVAGLNGVTVANSAISGHAYSKVRNPHGLPSSWITYTPTITNGSLGNGTLLARYRLTAKKTVEFEILFTLGSTSTVTGALTFSLPPGLNSSADYDYSNAIVGMAAFRDANGSALFSGAVRISSATNMNLLYGNVSSDTGRFSSVGSTNPMTWATSDVAWCKGSYRTA